MLPGFKMVEGFVWPIEDEDHAAVALPQRYDMETAIKYCKELRLVVQAGGNTGMWPHHMKTFFDAVHTFEPEPRLFQCLDLNCDIKGIYRYQCALGARPSRVSLEFPETRRNLGATCIRPEDGYGEIPMGTIDEFMFDACDLIQLDIEGYEPLAIQGAAETIARFRPVLMLEDKGLSTKYGWEKGWWRQHSVLGGYIQVDAINRDIILAPARRK